VRHPDFLPESVIDSLFEGIPLPNALKLVEWPQLLDEKSVLIDKFLRAFEEHSGAVNLAARARRRLEGMVLQISSSESGIFQGSTYWQIVEITNPIAAIDVPSGADRATLAVFANGFQIGAVTLPVYSGHLSVPVISDAIAGQLAEEILTAYFNDTLYPELNVEASPESVCVRRGGAKLFLPLDFAQDNSEEPEFWKAAQPYVCWPILLQEVWGLPDWDLDQFYSIKHANFSAKWVFAGNVVYVDIFDELPTIIRMSSTLSIVVTLAGATLGVIPVKAGSAFIMPQELRSWVNILFGKELASVVVRECVIGRKFEATGSIKRIAQELLRSRRAKASSSTTHGPLPALTAFVVNENIGQADTSEVILRSEPLVQDGSTSRRTTLPTTVASEAMSLFNTTTNTKRLTESKDGLLLREPAAPSPALLDASASSTPLSPGEGYVLRHRSPLARIGQIASRIMNGASTDKIDALPGSITSEYLPVLMYHRIAAHGAHESKRWRTSPDDFRDQLQLLKQYGFKSVTLEEWYCYRTVRKPMPFRPVLITFDDGYLDFYDNAWPLLKEYGFNATMYLVSERIGQTNSWDAARGEELPLMTMDQIRELRDQGVEFGCHTATHPQLTGIPSDEVVSELARSRATLRRELGLEINSLAYPFGEHDDLVASIAGSCGINFALTCEDCVASYSDSLLKIPRIEVNGYYDLRTFRNRLLDGE
jgi:peptidoglycan/xylan/chitin deacetylase (PgdA/CDA1 family)